MASFKPLGTKFIPCQGLQSNLDLAVPSHTHRVLDLHLEEIVTYPTNSLSFSKGSMHQPQESGTRPNTHGKHGFPVDFLVVKKQRETKKKTWRGVDHVLNKFLYVPLVVVKGNYHHQKYAQFFFFFRGTQANGALSLLLIFPCWF